MAKEKFKETETVDDAKIVALKNYVAGAIDAYDNMYELLSEAVGDDDCCHCEEACVEINKISNEKADEIIKLLKGDK